MKKIVLMAFALLSMTTAFAADEKAEANNAAVVYGMEINMSGLTKALRLSSDQQAAVRDIHTNFNADMLNAAGAPAEARKEMVDKAIEKDLEYMRTVLSKKQYRTYVMLLNATINNRGIER